MVANGRADRPGGSHDGISDGRHIFRRWQAHGLSWMTACGRMGIQRPGAPPIASPMEAGSYPMVRRLCGLAEVRIEGGKAGAHLLLTVFTEHIDDDAASSVFGRSEAAPYSNSAANCFLQDRVVGCLHTYESSDDEIGSRM